MQLWLVPETSCPEEKSLRVGASLMGEEHHLITTGGLARDDDEMVEKYRGCVGARSVKNSLSKFQLHNETKLKGTGRAARRVGTPASTWGGSRRCFGRA